MKLDHSYELPAAQAKTWKRILDWSQTPIKDSLHTGFTSKLMQIIEVRQDRKLKLNLGVAHSAQVSAWLSVIAFNWLSWLQTLAVFNWKWCQRSFPSFSHSCLFNWNLIRRPVLEKVVDPDLQLCKGFDLEDVDCPKSYFQSETNEWL